jgi:hypothetical protein
VNVPSTVADRAATVTLDRPEAALSVRGYPVLVNVADMKEKLR